MTSRAKPSRPFFCFFEAKEIKWFWSKSVACTRTNDSRMRTVARQGNHSTKRLQVVSFEKYTHILRLHLAWTHSLRIAGKPVDLFSSAKVNRGLLLLYYKCNGPKLQARLFFESLAPGRHRQLSLRATRTTARASKSDGIKCLAQMWSKTSASKQNQFYFELFEIKEDKRFFFNTAKNLNRTNKVTFNQWSILTRKVWKGLNNFGLKFGVVGSSSRNKKPNCSTCFIKCQKSGSQRKDLEATETYFFLPTSKPPPTKFFETKMQFSLICCSVILVHLALLSHGKDLKHRVLWYLNLLILLLYNK